MVIIDSVGRLAAVGQLRAGDFFGEIAILMATSTPSSVCTAASCRLARLEPQELLRRFAVCSARIMQKLNERVQSVQAYMLKLPSSRVRITGSRLDAGCRGIRTFLSMNRVPFQWVDSCRLRRPPRTLFLAIITRLQLSWTTHTASCRHSMFAASPKRSAFTPCPIGQV